MDHKAVVREFLVSRRAKISPEQAGLPAYGGNRRVPGLRREEVALLAGVSVDYYTRLERGNLGGVSEGVLESLARALQLDEAEREHLSHLARAANTSKRPRAGRPTQQRVRPVVQRILDSMVNVPAFVRNERLDVMASNQLGAALYSELYTDPGSPVNHARFAFLNPRATEFWVDWDKAARDTVAILRAEAGRNPYDRALTDLVGELSTRSETFRTLWASHDVRLHRSGTKSFNHPVVGRLDLSYEKLDLPADTGLTILAYSAEPGTPSAEGISMLASWAATTEQERLTTREQTKERTPVGETAETAEHEGPGGDVHR